MIKFFATRGENPVIRRSEHRNKTDTRRRKKQIRLKDNKTP